MALEAASAENLSSGLDADLSGFLGAVFVIWMATPDLFACERADEGAKLLAAAAGVDEEILDVVGSLLFASHGAEFGDTRVERVLGHAGKGE